MKRMKNTNLSIKLAHWLKRNVSEGQQAAVVYPAPHSSIIAQAQLGNLVLVPKSDPVPHIEKRVGKNTRYVQLPEPIVLLPIPKWVVDMDNNTELYGVWMFQSEAREALKVFQTELDKVKESL